jgi:hypothetical protein
MPATRWHGFVHQCTLAVQPPGTKDHDRDPVEESSPEPFADRADDLVFELPHREEMYAITGTTQADNLRNAYARVQLLDCLADDQQFLTRLADWGHRIGLLHATEELARVAEEAAQYLGLEHRSDLWREREPAPIPQADDASTEAILHRLVQAGEHWCEAIARLHELLDPVCTYVRDELRLDWPWLALEMIDGLAREAWGHVFGIEVVQVYRLDHPDPEVSPFEYTFQTRPGETLSAAQQRFIAEANAAFAQMQAVPHDTVDVPTGRFRKDLEETIRRYTRWLHRQRFCQEKPYQIAKAYHAERNPEDHKSASHYHQLILLPSYRKPLPFNECTRVEGTLHNPRQSFRYVYG